MVVFADADGVAACAEAVVACVVAEVAVDAVVEADVDAVVEAVVAAVPLAAEDWLPVAVVFAVSAAVSCVPDAVELPALTAIKPVVIVAAATPTAPVTRRARRAG